MSNLHQEIAELLLPNIKVDIEGWEKKYPKRELSTNMVVTRFAPSPTGFLHIGGVFSALISKKAANQSGGIFILRIEDTDKKREIRGGVNEIIKSLNMFNITYDEGMIDNENEIGNYGPYIQSKRKQIYQSFVKLLIIHGKAYPCFCTQEELELLRNRQKTLNINTGYYGQFAIHRNCDIKEIEYRLEKKEKFIIRFKNEKYDTPSIYKDLIKGKISLMEHDEDIVLLKTNGLPTYHFAHVVDDHFMGTTHVLRGDEWIPSLPLHLKLFKALDWKVPLYGHIAPILKKVDSSKRKLSKRKDPEASIDFYKSEGYPADVVIEYLLNIANSDFENWRRDNPNIHHTDFLLKLSKLNKSGALFDIQKLNNIGMEYISTLDAECVYDKLLKWANTYDEPFYRTLKENKELSIKVLQIGRTGNKRRKDYAKWSDVKEVISYFFNEYFEIEKGYPFPDNIDKDSIIAIIKNFSENINYKANQEEWFEQMKQIAKDHNFAISKSEYQKNKELYLGTISDFTSIIRISLTKRKNSFDLYMVMNILGKDMVNKRLFNSINYLQKRK